MKQNNLLLQWESLKQLRLSGSSCNLLMLKSFESPIKAHLLSTNFNFASTKNDRHSKFVGQLSSVSQGITTHCVSTQTDPKMQSFWTHFDRRLWALKTAIENQWLVCYTTKYYLEVSWRLIEITVVLWECNISWQYFMIIYFLYIV